MKPRDLFDLNRDGELSAADLQQIAKDAKNAAKSLIKQTSGWDGRKFIHGLNIFTGARLGKFLHHVYQNFIVAIIVAALLFGTGYARGWKSKPINFGQREQSTVIIAVDKDTGKKHEIVIRTDGSGTFDGEPITQGLVPDLKPYGIHLKPKLAVGVSTTAGPVAGFAIETAHWNRLNLDVLYFVPDILGVGVSYDIYWRKGVKIENSAAGIGATYSLSDGTPGVVFYWTISF